MKLGLLRDHDFRFLFAATTVSQVGQQVTNLALPLVAVLALEASEFEVGLLFTFTTVAFLLLGLPAGAWVDRMRRRNTMIVADVARAVLLFSVPLAWWLDALTMWQLYAVALLTGAFTVFFDVAYQSYLPHLVGRENLMEGNAKLEGVRSVSQVAGPSLAGQIIAILTAPVAFVLEAVGLALSALFVGGIRKREEKPERKPGTNLWREIAEGVRFVVGHRLLRPIAASTALANLALSAFIAMEIVFLARVLELSERTIGLVLTVGAAGGVAGFMVVQRVVKRLGYGPAIWLSIALTSPFALLLALAEPGIRLWIGAAGLFVMSVGVVVYNVAQVSFRQTVTPDHLLGRMNATMRFLVWGTAPIGAVIGGVLGDAFGSRTALVLSAVAASLAFLPILLSPLRSMREAPAPPGGDSGSDDSLDDNPVTAVVPEQAAAHDDKTPAGGSA